MLLEGKQVGNQDDWAQFITIVDEIDNPFLAWLPVGSKPVNVLHRYQVDAFDAPTPSAHIDGKDWETFDSAAKNRAELKARVQWSDRTVAVSKLAEDVSNVAGVEDELAREIPRKLREMARSMECTFLSEQVAFEDNQVKGNQTQGAGLWIQAASTNQLYAVPAAYQTPTASIYADTMANLNENAVRTVVNSLFTQTGSKQSARLFCGLGLKQRFADFQFFVPASLYTGGAGQTQATARVSTRSAEANRLGNQVDFYTGDGGSLELEVDLWLYHPNFGGTTTKASHYGLIMHRPRWQLRWNQKPRVYYPEFKGGSYKAAMDCIYMLVCANPLGEGAIKPSD